MADDNIEPEDIKRKYEELRSFFYPKSVAVIGASSNPAKLGHNILKNLVSLGFPGKVFPINPKEKEILGLKCYPSVLDVPSEIDLSIIIIPADKVLGALEQCGEKGVKFVVIEAAGFAEMGEYGRELQSKIVEVARKYGIRVLGPNCAGFVNTYCNLATTFAPLPGLRKGTISIIAQAGIFAAGMLEVYPWGISKLITIGNKADLDETDFLEFLAEDPETSVIGMYIEGTRDGRRLMRVLRAVSRKKPVVVLKGGKTAAGSQLTLSHTASLAGDATIWDVALRQSGALKADSLEEFFDLLKFFSMQPPMRGPRLSIISYSGSMGILSVDHASSLGLELAAYDDNTLEVLKQIAFPWTSCFNPLDLSFLVTAEQYQRGVEILLHNRNVDGIICIVPAMRVKEVGQAVHEIMEAGCVRKPVVFCVPMGDIVIGDVQEVEKLGIPCYFTPERAVNVLARSLEYSTWLKREG
ncbi:MAG: acetate--CoA ligase family protein [Candidatus Baldrarchaeia archaeon]